MISKIYDKFINFIKENYKQLIFLIVFLIVMSFPLDYSVMVSGGTINVNDRVSIKGEYESDGSYNLAYVTELKGTIPTVLLSYIIPDWKKIPLEEYKASSNESQDDITKRAKIYLKYSEQAAIKLAYLKASKEFKIKNSEFNIVYVDEKAETTLKIGDIILKANDITITSLEQYRNIVEKSDIGDTINLKILRDEKEQDALIKVKNIDNKKVSGISILELYDYETSPEIELSFKNNESGSSGGLMLALSIYDKLISEDLTNGLKIVGTGTIDFDGNVGEIDGVEYKLMGAVKQKADLFIVPTGENYETCLKLKEERGYNIELIEAKTFDETIEILRNYK